AAHRPKVGGAHTTNPMPQLPTTHMGLHLRTHPHRTEGRPRHPQRVTGSAWRSSLTRRMILQRSARDAGGVPHKLGIVCGAAPLPAWTSSSAARSAVAQRFAALVV